MTARAAAGCGRRRMVLGRARRHLERAAAELEEARLAWGVWADGVRQLAERRLGVSAAEGFAVLDDPDTRGRRMGAWFDQAAAAAGAALEAGGAGAGLLPGCPCRSAKEQ